MASVPYLTGGETPTADRMNALFSVFDAKLAAIMGNKSFILGFCTDPVAFLDPEFRIIPNGIMGKAFFFVDETKVSPYAHRCQDAISLSGVGNSYKIRAYNHTPFTNAATASTKTGFDTAKRIVTITQIPSTFYTNGLAAIAECSLFDHSLEAHKYVRPLDGKTYWMRETQVSQAEKRYKYAVAELVLENVTAVTLPESYDKYNFFRIHNLNLTSATVTFGSSYTVNLLPLECKTVRRDNPTTNYRLGYRYFFKFEPGDYRHFWFWTNSFVSGTNSIDNYTHPYPSNSMVANNITNPATVYDWIKQFNYDDAEFDRDHRAGWFHLDPHELCDIYPLNASKFGDPSSPTTKLGDLIHHKGKILLARMTNFSIASNRFRNCAVSEIEFTGYDSLVATLTAEGFTVTVVSGVYQIKFPTANAFIEGGTAILLIPWGTNFLKVGETIDAVYPFTGPVSSFSLEKIVFDNQSTTPTLSNPSPRLIAGKIEDLTPDSRTYLPVGATLSVLVPAPKIPSLVGPPAGTPKTLTGPQSVTVADLLTLIYFGDQTLVSQDTNATIFDSPQMKLTPFGLALTCDERVTTVAFPPLGGGDVCWKYPGGFQLRGDFNSGYFARPRIIKFRGHGWPHIEDGRKYSMCFSPRYGRHFIQNGYLDTVNGADGKDFEIHSMGAIESDVRLLRLISGTQDNSVGNAMLVNGTKRQPFWQFATTSGKDRFNAIADKYLLSTKAEFEAWIIANFGIVSNAPWVLASTRPTTYPLLPEHYNGMAQMINQCKQGKAIDGYALRFVVSDNIYSLESSTVNRLSRAWTYRIPTPVDCYDCWTGTNPPVYAALGIPIRTSSDFPSDYAPAAAKRRVDRTINFTLAAAVSGVHAVTGPDIFDTTEGGGFPPHSGTDWWAAQIDVTAGIDSITYADAGSSGIAIGNVVVGGLTGGFPTTIDLNSSYSGFKWVKIADVKAFIEALGMNFSFENFFSPAMLSILKSPRGYSPGAYDSRSATYPERIYAGGFGTLSAPVNSHTPITMLHAGAEIVAFEPPIDPADTTWKQAVNKWVDNSTTYESVWDRREYKAFTPSWAFAQFYAIFVDSATLSGTDDVSYRGGLGWNYNMQTAAGGLYVTADTFLEFRAPSTGFQFSTATVGDHDNGPFVHIEFEAADDDEQDLLDRFTSFTAWLRKPMAFQSHNSVAAPVAKTRVLLSEKPFWATKNDWWRDSINGTCASLNGAITGLGPSDAWVNVVQNGERASAFALSSPIFASSGGYKELRAPTRYGPWEPSVPVDGSFRGGVQELTNGPIQFIEADPPEDGEREHGTEFNVVQELVNVLQL